MVWEELRRRELIYQCTDEEGTRKYLESGEAVVYAGFDATADCLHLGNLLILLTLRRLKESGVRVIVLIGTGTTLVGDPSGKSEERPLLPEDVIKRNAEGIGEVVKRVLGEDVKVLGNAEWLKSVKLIDFLRDYGKHFSVSRMVKSDVVARRLETGISYLEFSYSLLQAYDFFHLYQTEGCRLQAGGQDQWFNIVQGVELIRRKAGKEVYGFTVPLLLDASGKKFGKSESGSLFLCPHRTHPFELYQYLRSVDDRDVGRFLKKFTFLPVEECEYLGSLEPPLINRAKEILGYEVLKSVYGREKAVELYSYAVDHYGMADPEGKVRTTSDIEYRGGGSAKRVKVTLEGGRITLPKLLVACGFAASSSEAKRLIKGGGVYVNGERVIDLSREFSAGDFPLKLKVGKKKLAEVEV
jgi:tyrosyl-tRNA synthetase